MRLPSETHPVPSGSAGWAEIRSEATNPSAWVSFPNFDIPRRGTPSSPSLFLALPFLHCLPQAAISGYLVYRMISPARSHSEIDLQNFPGHPEKLDFTVQRGRAARRLVFPGLEIRAHDRVVPGLRIQPRRTAHAGLGLAGPAIQRASFLIFRRTGRAGGRSTLGLQEVAELRAAMDAVANRGDVDANRFGLWGVNLGAYVALAEATNDRRVRAVAAESPYNDPNEMVALQVSRSGLGSIPLVTRMSQMIFGWLNRNMEMCRP